MLPGLVMDVLQLDVGLRIEDPGAYCGVRLAVAIIHPAKPAIELADALLRFAGPAAIA